MKNLKTMETGTKRFAGQIQKGQPVLVRPALALSTNRDSEQSMRSLTHDLDERVKELNCFYGISGIVEEPGNNLDEMLQRIAELIPLSWHTVQVRISKRETNL